MTCSRTVEIPEGSKHDYQMIRCCDEIKPCDGSAGAVAGACEIVDPATARFYMKNQSHSMALTARTDYQVVPEICGTTGVGAVSLAVVVTLPDASAKAYTVVSDANGEWHLDLSEDAADDDSMLDVSAFSDGSPIVIDITGTIGSCGTVTRNITGNISVASTSC